MPTQIDYQLGLGLETTYGTGVTPSRFFESEVAFDYTPVKVQGAGTRPGKAVNRLNRNKLARVEVSGSQDLEVPTSGFGFLLKAALGDVSSAQVATSGVYQHVATHRTASDYLDSYTVQGVLPELGSSTRPFTFTGCMVKSLELSVSEGGILTAKLDWVGKDMTTATAAAVASYPDSDLFTFVDGQITIGSTVTAPTSTALATATATITNPVINDFSVKIDNGLDSAGYGLGGAGKRSRKNALGMRAITGKISAEFRNELVSAYTAQTPLAVVLNFVGSKDIATSGGPQYATLQIVLPSILLKGGLPKSNKADVIKIDHDFEAFDNGVAVQPIWVVYRSTDTAV